MTKLPQNLRDVDWSLATWEGSRREQLRRWAALPLDLIIASLEEMQELAAALGAEDDSSAAGEADGAASGRPT